MLPPHAKRRDRLRTSPDAPPDAGAVPVVPDAALDGPADGDAASRAPSGSLLGIPRVFSLRSARFELPLNSAALNCELEIERDMQGSMDAQRQSQSLLFPALTPMEFVTKHVEVCNSSAQLYRRVFNLHREGAALPQQQQHDPPPVPVPEVLDDEPRVMLGGVRDMGRAEAGPIAP